MSLFSATIKLTDSGLQNLSLVLSIFFSYLASLRDSDKLHLQFNETAQIKHTEFRFQSKRSSTGYVDEIARRMQVVPMRFILNDYPYLDFDFADISSLVDCLTASNCIGLLSYRCEKGDSVWMQEPVYSIEYSKWDKARWDSSCGLPVVDSFIQPASFSLHLPDPNPFLCTDFRMIDGCSAAQNPELVFLLAWLYCRS